MQVLQTTELNTHTHTHTHKLKYFIQQNTSIKTTYSHTCRCN